MLGIDHGASGMLDKCWTYSVYVLSLFILRNTESSIPVVP